MSTEPGHLDCEIRVLNREQATLRTTGKGLADQRDFSDRTALDEALEVRLRELLDDPMEYGKELFAALLPPDSDLRTGYRDALATARQKDEILRVRLFVEPTAPPELHGLLWERLYDAKRGSALACSREVSLSRTYGGEGAAGEPLKERLKLLVVISNPSNLDAHGLASVDRDTSRRAIEAALKPLEPWMSWKVLEGPATAEEISDRLVEGKFHALHLQGHGILRSRDSSALLVLEKPDGTADFVGEDFFSQIFEGDRNLRLVTLIACHGGQRSGDNPFSGLGPALVRRGIPAVLAMGQAIRVETAERFCRHFYRNLARSGVVDRAANEARHQLLLSIRDADDWSTPVLFLRLRDGRLWEPGQPRDDDATIQTRPVKWSALLDRIKSDDLVPFLGPGVSRGLLLSHEEIAKHWVEAYDGFPLDRRTDLPAVAQFVETKEGLLVPHDRLPKILLEDLLERENVRQREPLQNLTLSEVIDLVSQRHFDQDPDEPHRILADLNLSTYITTTYDNFMAAALRWRHPNRTVKRHHCLWRSESPEIKSWYKGLKGSRDEPLVFHLYGSDEETASLVLTEDNHLQFLWAMAREPARLPNLLRGKLAESVLLFLGYDLRRLDCRVLLRAVVAPLRQMKGRGRIAVLQLDPEDDLPHIQELRLYIEECCKSEDLQIEVYWGSVRKFLKELRDRLGGRNG